MRLYRYRNIDNAFKELEKGTFYFANYKELNDPIEGYIRLYWQGDKYAWEGLFKNYICSLYNSIQYYLVCDERNYLDSKQYCENDLNNIVRILDVSRFNNLSFGKILQNLYEKFLNNEFIQKVVNFFSDNKKIYSKQIKLLFLFIHNIALNICLEELNKYLNFELLALKFFLEKTCPKICDLIDLEQLNIIYKDYKHCLNFVNLFCENETERNKLFSSYFNDLNKEKIRNIHYNLVFCEYPDIYIEQLKDIIYPDGHVVCFSTNPNNSSMWGNYTNNHKGICFIYETKNIDNKEVIPVEYFKIDIKPVKYENNLIERNFFLSLGRLTLPQINTWLSGINPNELSDLLHDYLSIGEGKIEENKWKNEYWKNFEEIFFRKMIDWKYESEYRMLMPDSLHELKDKTKRVKQYDKECLKGIIFGIRTNIEDKMNLIEKIRNLGKNIKEFEFYQASYDEEDKKIILNRLYYE